MESSSVNSMCRCCASEGAFKDIKTSYHWMGEEEVYGDMLRECFDVNLSSADQGGICEVCITQLRNAANFKKQVLNTESQFKQHLRSKGFKAAHVKEEKSAFDDDSDDNDMDNIDDEDYVPEYDVPIKLESEHEDKPRKRGAKAASTRAKKSKSNDGEATVKSFVQTGDGKVKKEVEKWSCDKLPEPLLRMPRQCKKTTDLTPIDLRNPKTVTKVDRVATQKKVKIDHKEIEKQLPELHKHRYNIRMILQYSNATPIRAHYAGTGFACGFCKEFFHKAADLKSHTIDKHNKDKVKFMQTKSLSKFTVKLDITALNCNICKMDLNTVEELTDHLNKTHEKGLYTDIKNQIVCFKLAGDAIKCMFCQIEYTTFKPLLEHMNQHYKNFICEICAAGFVSQGMLARHATAHTVGEFKCRSCDKVFDTQNKVRQHEKFHTGFKFKCFQCGEKFSSVKLKKDHMTTVHGAKYEFKCPACDRQFTNKVTLWAHKRRDHLLERRFVCEHCDMRFFSKAERDNHMVTHTDIREFLCEICCKAFRLKKTLRQHMRTHSNDKQSRSITVHAPVNERPPAVEPRTFFF